MQKTNFNCSTFNVISYKMNKLSMNSNKKNDRKERMTCVGESLWAILSVKLNQTDTQTDSRQRAAGRYC